MRGGVCTFERDLGFNQDVKTVTNMLRFSFYILKIANIMSGSEGEDKNVTL